MSMIDLHMHSLYSDDGEFSVIELIDKCLAKKLSYFSISDHNSIRACSEAVTYTHNHPITFIPGIELDCIYQNVQLHVLGYGIDYQNPRYEQIRLAIHAQELIASQQRLASVKGLGIHIDDATITALSIDGIITGEMLAEAALMNDNNRELAILQPYRANGLRSNNPYVNFYWDYCSAGKPAFVHINFISLNEAISLIHQSGGVAVLAHPGMNTKEEMAILDGIIASGIDGIEVYSSYHTKQQIDFYRQLAINHNLLTTCGSDFHGKTKPAIMIGDIQVNEDEHILIEQLIKKIEYYQLVKLSI